MDKTNLRFHKQLLKPIKVRQQVFQRLDSNGNHTVKPQSELFQPNINKSKTFEKSQIHNLALSFNNEHNTDNKLLSKDFINKILQSPQIYLQNLHNDKFLKEISYQNFQQIIEQLLLSNYYKDKSNQGKIIQICLWTAQKVLGDKSRTVVQNVQEEMLLNKVAKSEVKILIAHELLKITMCITNIMNKRLLNNHLNHQICQKINPFQVLNKWNKKILSFLKSQYPRNKNLSVPYQMIQKFREVDFSTKLDNDMIINSGFSFSGQMNRKQCLNKIKSFLNSLIDQVNQKFQCFQKLLMQKVFSISISSTVKQNSIKIGRKIPENVQKFYDFDSQNLDITSPQMFRVIIKWIQKLQQLLMNPSQSIIQLDGIKYTKTPFDETKQSKLKYFYLQSSRFQNVKQVFIQCFGLHQSFKDQLSCILSHLDRFNNNLVKTLSYRRAAHNFLRNQQVSILKLAKFDTEFIEWLVVDKLLILIKTLNNVSKQIQKNIFKRVDFIDFSVFDLLRACFSGSIKQINQIFDNLKQLQSQNEIVFIRIKNRLATPLNDILINFKMKQCLIICELQLVLAQTMINQGEQKLKINQKLNHTIYEFERSPYGSISQMSLTIGYVDPSIYYADTIQFQPEWNLKDKCQDKNYHSFQQIQSQITPFVCSWCMKFYTRLQNFFEYYRCDKCYLEKCKSCIFQQNKQEQKTTYSKYLAQCILNLSKDKISASDYQQFIENIFVPSKGSLQFLSGQYICVKDQINVSKKMGINGLQKTLQKLHIQSQLQKKRSLYVLLLHFQSGNCSLHLLKYFNYKVTLVTYDKKQIKLTLGQHDALFLFDSKIYFKGSKRLIQFRTEVFNLEKPITFYDIRNGQIIQIVNRKIKATYIIVFSKKYLLSIFQINDQLTQTKLQQIKTSFNKILKKNCQYSFSQQILIVKSLRLSDQILSQINFYQWTKKIKVLNLQKNRIKSIDSIMFTNESLLKNVRELYLNNNLLQNINVLQVYQSLQILQCASNNFQTIPKSINNLVNLISLNFNYNQNLYSIPELNLVNLEQIYLRNNKIKDFKQFFQSYSSKNLQILQICDTLVKIIPKNQSNKVSNKNKQQIHKNKTEQTKDKAKQTNDKIEQINNQINILKKQDQHVQQKNKNSQIQIQHKNEWFQFVKFQKLRKIQLSDMDLNIKSIDNLKAMKYIEMIDLSKNKIQKLTIMQQRYLKIIKLNFCQLENINQIFTNKLVQLTELQLNNNSIKDFPSKLILKNLKNLQLNFNQIQNIDSIRDSQLNLLQTLDLSNNSIVNIQILGQIQLPQLITLNITNNKILELPFIVFPKLKILNLTKNQINTIDKFTNSDIPFLSTLNLIDNKLTTLPKLEKFQNLQIFIVSKNKIEQITDFSQSKLSKWGKMWLNSNNISIVMPLNFENVTSLFLFENKLTDISFITKTNLPNINLISFYKNQIKELPIFKFKSLKKVLFTKNLIQNIDNLSEWQTDELKILDLSFNKIKRLPKLLFYKLNNLLLNNNQINEIEQFFSQSRLPQIQKLDLTFNLIQNLPKIDSSMLNLVQLNVNNNKIISIQQFTTKSNLKKLKKFSMNVNKLTQIHQFNNFSNLEQIYMRKNVIQKIINQQKLLSIKLKHFFLTQNKLTYFPESIIQTNNLEELSLSRNFIQNINLSPSIKIKRLLLVGCHIKDINLQKLSLPFVQELNLRQNFIQNLTFLIKQDAFPMLERLNLKQNRIKQLISINLSKLQSLWLFDNPIEQMQHFYQSFLPSLRNLYLVDSSKKEIQKKQKHKQNKQQVQPANIPSDLEENTAFAQDDNFLQNQLNQIARLVKKKSIGQVESEQKQKIKIRLLQKFPKTKLFF